MKHIVLPTFVAITVLFTGCASYDAAPLNSLSSQIIQSGEQAKAEDVTIVAKTFNKADCRRYLDRDVIRKGYQPIQLFIQNNSDKSYIFSLNRLSLPVARPDEVADKVHTSTTGRVVGYGVGALFLWPLAIPAVVDGIKSSQANSSLDSDYSAKTAVDQTIMPHSHFNKIVFVPVQDYQSAFNVTLVDQQTSNPKTIKVNAN